MAIRPAVLSISVGVAFLLLFLLAFNHWHKPTEHQLNPDLEWLGIIDLNDNNEVDLKEILNGGAVVLVVDHATELYHKLTQKIPQTTQLQTSEMLNLINLHLLDADNNGVIDNKDPIFQHLYAIKFTHDGEDHDIQPISAIGVRNIYVQRRTPTGNHIVTMSDGSQRTLYNASKFEP